MKKGIRRAKIIGRFGWIVPIMFCFLISVMRSEHVEAYAEITENDVGTVENVTIKYNGGEQFTIQLNENNDLEIVGRYYHDSNATLSYRSYALYFTLQASGGNPMSVGSADRYTYILNGRRDGGVDEKGYIRAVFTMKHEELLEMLEWLFEKEELRKGNSVTVYMSEGFKLVKRNSPNDSWSAPYGQILNSLEKVRNAAGWTETTFNNFEMYFDVPLTFEYEEFDDLFTEPSKKYRLEIEEEGNGLVTGDRGEFEEGELVYEKASPDNGWRFKEWKGNKAGIEGVDWESEYIWFRMPARDVTLVAVFEEIGGVTPIPTGVPLATVTPVPTPTAGPSPTPSPTPTPRPYPEEDKKGYQLNYRYYTTDKGYSIEEISSKVKLADYKSVDGGEVSHIFARNASYLVGTDILGNEWYFTPVGENATYVHPKRYKGKSVSDADIRYIQELTFPEKVSCSGKEYTVTSIGGGLSWYNSMSAFANDPYDNSSYNTSGVGGGTMFSRGKTSGYYTYYYVSANNSNYEKSIQENLSYRFGVIGNGSVTSGGGPRQFWPTTGAEISNEYVSTYTVYNTTLAEITIPECVTRIEDYAFADCQALIRINGGNGIKEIGRYAFSTDTAELKLSYEGENNSYCYYLYNNSYAMAKPWTDVMSEYDETRQLSGYMSLAVFPSLKRIEEAAFLKRTNLFDVKLPTGVGEIEKNAFKDCSLNSIEVPGMSTVVEGERYTLGTKGYGTEISKTAIITEPESFAMNYGLEYIWYYKLRCGYEVTYENNFLPEESFSSKSELKEQLVTPVKTVELKYPGSVGSETVLFSLDVDGNVWYRPDENIIPQKLVFESEASDVFTGLGEICSAWYQYRPAGAASEVLIQRKDAVKEVAYVFLKNGEVYYLSDVITEGTDSKTPKKSVWSNLGIPIGSTSHQTVDCYTEHCVLTSFVNTTGNSAEEKTKEDRCQRIYYISPKGEIEYVTLGMTSQVLRTMVYDSGSGSIIYEEEPAAFLSGTSTNRTIIKGPDGVKFKKIEVVELINGGSSSIVKTETAIDDYRNTKTEYVATICMPEIYATATDGTVWVAKAVKTSSQTYEVTRDRTGTTVKGTPISEIVLSDEDYRWERADSLPGTDVKESCIPSGSFAGIVPESRFDCFYISTSGELIYRRVNGAETHLKEDVVFCGFYIAEGYDFAIDEEGYLWMLPVNTNTLPVRLFRDAEINKIIAHKRTVPVYEGTGETASVSYKSKTEFMIYDTCNRLWELSLCKGDTEFSIPSLIYTFPADIKKISWSSVTGSDGNDNKNQTLYEPNKESFLILLENGELYAYGENCTSEDIWRNGQTFGREGYYSVNGKVPGMEQEPKKISGDILVEDVIHKKNYSLVLDNDGVVYRIGYHMFDEGTSDSIPVYTPGKYDTLTPVSQEMEYDGSTFLAGYHFAEELYDNMFFRDGYTFLYWNEQADNKGKTRYPGEELITEGPVRIYAQWEKTVNKVRYHPNGGSGVMEDSVCDPAITTTVMLAECEYSMDGYGFVGWNTKRDGTGYMYQPGDDFTTSTGTTYVYAQWEPLDYVLKVAGDEIRVRPVTVTEYDLKYNQEFTIPKALDDKEFSVEYNLNGKKDMSTTPRWKTTVPLTENYTKAKMEFVGWRLYEEMELNSVYHYLNRFYLPGQKDKNFARHRIYAPILFPYWAGEYAYVDLPVAECDGYWFLGWSETADETEEENILHAEEGSGATYRPKENETLYGFYRPKTYEISLYAEVAEENPGVIRQKQTVVTVTFDEKVPDVYVPESEHYVFMGYYDKLDENGVPAEDAVCYYDREGAGQQIWRIFDGSVTELYAYFVYEKEVILDGRGATKQEQTSVLMTYEKVGPDVIPPEKTGYTFQGYYTGIRGSGTQYFSSNGTGSAVWKEKDVDVLYAYWIQDPVETPEKDDIDIPDGLPEERVLIEAISEGASVQIYADDNNPETDALTDIPPYQVSDIVIDNGLESVGGIPSTEKVALRAKTGSWLLSCVLERKSGVDEVCMRITVPYRTQYENEDDESLIVSDILYETLEVYVPKEWSYWVLADGGIYIPEKVIAINGALENGRTEVPVNWDCIDAAKKPSYEFGLYGEKEQHISWETYDENGMPVKEIKLTEAEYIVSDVPGELPDVMSHLKTVCYNAAWNDETEFSVKSDKISVEGVSLLEDTVQNSGKGASPDLHAVDTIRSKIEETSFRQAYLSGINLKETAENERYETEAEICYRSVAANAGGTSKKRLRVNDVNEINIHTPVLCNSHIEADHEEMYQCEEIPEEHTVLVLDEEGIHSDFVLRIDNFGYHSDKQGYGEREYKDFLSMKDGKVRNEVSFPFEVWVDVGNDKDRTNDIRFPAGEWFLLGEEEQRFYLPTETAEGSYEIKFRSVAVNGEERETMTEPERNTQPAHYVAEDIVKVYVTGRLYDLTVYEVGGNVAWKEAAKEGYSYTVGPQTDAEELQRTLPLRKGVHSLYQNAGGLPAGGYVKFRLKSIGSSFEEGTKLTIVPHIVSVKDGGYEEVDIYYEEKTEQGIFLKRWDAKEHMLCLENPESARDGVREWEGSFGLPAQLYIVEAGTDVKAYQKKHGLSFTEEFWVKDAILMVRLEIAITNPDGESLYYGTVPANIRNNIWQTEAGQLYREDTDGNRFEIQGGEVAVIYPGDCGEKDYTIHGIY